MSQDLLATLAKRYPSYSKLRSYGQVPFCLSFIFLFAFVLSFIGHDKFFNPNAPAITLNVFLFWLIAIVLSVSFLRLGFSRRAEAETLLESLYPEPDILKAIKAGWCPRCLGTLGRTCIKYAENPYMHGIVLGKHAFSRRSTIDNPILKDLEKREFAKLDEVLFRVPKPKNKDSK